ncbi:MAG: nicotinamide mononucleotide transporter [Clostridia bacterium]|nr:nicotinamide mononucleotide transporter [Clostridia bacterium]
MKNPFKLLTKFDYIFWSISVTVLIVFFAVFKGDVLTLICSLVGITGLIFVAKGHILGQIITIVFAVVYAIISFGYRYYSELITYAFMTLPMAIIALISWIKHPYKNRGEVEISKVSKKQIIICSSLALIITVGFYFLLKFLNTPNLLVSTFSITTSFVAVYLTALRSPYYAVAYACNDIVLIVLWVLATIDSISYLPMVICFCIFFLSDIYGFVSWKIRQKRQSK